MLSWRELIAAIFWLGLILLAVLGSTLGQTQFIYNQF
ncbi:hypothetical protein CFE_0284 [Carboxydocella thermautotrophica]|uniref:Uncharacterized protein n=1 Tax=Carboxydocella thermautotrophica TaxID=178899 RepID=A0A2R4MXC6_CARTR|nr:hypothetical protein CFE_0284 [Carboxydocella thermautotrophica]AVX29901.1 hypothetical protein CTH_0292 [Carboxydocella thermautotrophica]